MSALTELEIETEQNDPPICINFSSFLEESFCSVPDLEELPNPDFPIPDLTEVPNFLSQNYQTRDCTHILNPHPLIIHFHCKTSYLRCKKIIHYFHIYLFT